MPASAQPSHALAQPQPQPQPPPVPISESDNPDAIALRSALSILQLQKQQSLHDIRTLETMKRAAMADPERFATELLEGRLTTDEKESRTGIIDFSDEGQQAQQEEQAAEGENSHDRLDDKARFGRMPAPQNVVRMPPVNWAKYHIVGEPLEKMHEEQRRRPSAGEPRRGSLLIGRAGPPGENQQRAPEYVLAAPYRPLVDRLEDLSKQKSPIATKRKS